MSNIRAISSYRLAGFVCELDRDEMNLIDAAASRHLDLMRHYNAIVKVSEDREKYITALSDVLSKLQDITGTGSNDELLDAVKKLISGPDLSTADEKSC